MADLVTRAQGGADWKMVRSFYENVFNVSTPQESTRRTIAALREADRESAAVIVAHNGPSGLGGRAHDICGVDFREEQGDHGDPDLRAALDEAYALGRCASLPPYYFCYYFCKDVKLWQLVNAATRHAIVGQSQFWHAL